jgi:hypothetical protein
MRKPRVLNPPDRIFLQYGPIDEDVEHDFCDEVTWCHHAIHDADVEYRLVKRRKRVSSPQTAVGAATDG